MKAVNPWIRTSSLVLVAILASQACSKSGDGGGDGDGDGDGHAGDGDGDAGDGDEDAGDGDGDAGDGDGDAGDGDAGDGDGDTGDGDGTMGGAGGMSNPDLCEDVQCEYGESCEGGTCVALCDGSEVYCAGRCIEPETSQRFCGAVAGCDGGAAEGLGGAGGGANLPDTAGEWCGDADACVGGMCEQVSLFPGSDTVIEREGFRVQCTQWNGGVCEKPWISVPADRIVEQGTEEGCVDDTTELRPIWFYNEGVEEAETFCAVATGDSSVQEVSSSTGILEELGGWMYGTFVSLEDQTSTCDGFRKYSEVDSPGDVDNIVWSFDLFSEVRQGEFLGITCNWP